MEVNKTEIRTRYCETDNMGIIHHSNYVNYFEVGRTEWLRAKGISYSEMEKEGIILPVVSVQCRYYLPAYYDEVLTVHTSLKELSGVRVVFLYEVYNQGEKKLCQGETTLVFTHAKTRKPMRPPQFFVDLAAIS